MASKLTDKQALFVKEYLIDLNASQAALRAGYSPKSAPKIGFQLLEKTRIQEEIKRAMDARGQRTEVTADKVVEQLAKIAFFDIKHVVEWDEKGIRIRPSDEVDGTILTEVSETLSEGGWTKKVKMADRMRALEMLGKHLGIFNDKLKVDIDTSLADILLKSWNDDR